MTDEKYRPIVCALGVINNEKLTNNQCANGEWVATSYFTNASSRVQH
jgi:hypothetical protein